MAATRRQFIRNGLQMSAGVAFAAGGFPGLQGASGRSLPSERINCAVIGVGGRGSALMRWALTHKATQITCICDINDRNRGRAVKTVQSSQGSAPEAVTDFNEVFSSSTVDAVIVATQHHWHAPIAVRALNAGKHVYCEKPASHVFREGRLIAEAARRHQCVFQHGTQMRSSEVTAAAAKVLASGVLGEIKMSKAWGVEPRSNHPAPVPDSEPPEWLDWDRWLGPAPWRKFNRNRFSRWNSYRDYGNGEIGGDGIHDIDMARWGLGVNEHPVRITAHGSRILLEGESDYPDNMMVTYQYAGNKVLIYENRNIAPYKMHGWDNGNIFYGTRGYMVFSRRGYFQTYLGGAEKEGPGMRGGAGNQENVHHFLDCVLGGKQANANADIAHLSCGLVHLGEVAYRVGRVLRFDPKKEAIVGDDEADGMLTKKYRKPWGFDKA